ncbi:MAG: tetratricopeptide repeat protein [Gemmataceae bacterium]
MKRNTFARAGAFGLAVGAACFLGCRHPGGPVRNGLPVAGDIPRTELTARQTADLQVAYARSLEKRGEMDQAMTRYQEAVKQDPERGDAWLRLAILHDRAGKATESAEMYRKAIALRPGDPEIFCDVGYSFYLQQRWAEAEMNLRQALALRPDHPRARNNLGLLLARTGRDGEALAEFRKAGCAETDAHANVAFALTLERRWPEARQHYGQALAADPTSKVARGGLASLEVVLAKATSGPAEPSARPDGGVTQASYRTADLPASPEARK